MYKTKNWPNHITSDPKKFFEDFVRNQFKILGNCNAQNLQKIKTAFFLNFVVVKGG